MMGMSENQTISDCATKHHRHWMTMMGVSENQTISDCATKHHPQWAAPPQAHPRMSKKRQADPVWMASQTLRDTQQTWQQDGGNKMMRLFKGRHETLHTIDHCVKRQNLHANKTQTHDTGHANERN